MVRAEIVYKLNFLTTMIGIWTGPYDSSQNCISNAQPIQMMSMMLALSNSMVVFGHHPMGHGAQGPKWVALRKEKRGEFLQCL